MQAAASPRRRGLLGLLAIGCVALAAALVMQSSGWAQVSNFALVRALANGTAKVDPYHWETKDEAWYRGHYYSVKSPVLPALTLPVYEVLKASGGAAWARETMLHARENGSWRWRPSAAPGDMHGRNRIRTYHVRDRVEQATPLIWVLGLFGCVLPALLLMLLVRRLGDRLEPGYGAAAAVTLGLGTLILPFSTLYFSHVLAALIGFAGFAVLWWERDGERDRSGLLVLAGLLAGFAFATEYPLAISGVVLGIYAISRRARVRRGLAYAGGAVLGAMPLFAYNLWAFGSITHLSYADAVKVQGVTGHDVLGSNAGGFFGVSLPDPTAALALLFSAKGLFTLSPVLVMGVVGTVLLRRRGRRGEANVIAAVAAAYLIYDSGYWLPFGGGTPGPRFLIPAIPYLALPLVLSYRRFPLSTLALAVPSVLWMLTATLTFPLIGNDVVGFWAQLIAAANFEPTAVTALGAGHGWQGIVPVLALAGLALSLALASVRPRAADDARQAALAIAGWALAAACVPWMMGRQSAVGGDTGAAALIAVFAAAGLGCVAIVAAARALRRSSDVEHEQIAAALAGQRQA